MQLSQFLYELTAGEEAERLGLKHVGWGKYANKQGIVTHVSKDGKLVPVQTNTPKKTGRRPMPSPIKGKEAPKPLDKKTEEIKTIPVEQAPTKKNPTFQDLSYAAKQHKHVIMSKKPIKNINFDPKRYKGGDPKFKPVGLWYAMGSEWVDWVSHEVPDWKGSYLYSLEINPEKMLILDTPQKVMAFHKKYARNDSYFGHNFTVDWSQLKDEGYDGVQIANKENGKYIWDLRMELNWYYTWDVGSGCIWNPDAIKSAKQISVGTAPKLIDTGWDD